MPTTITVPFKVLAKDYEIQGDVRTGYSASVPYLVAWDDAFTFADDVFGLSSADVIGPITWRAPYRFPVSVAALYAQRFTIRPCGANGEALGPYKGLAPGEFFSHAKITVEFETPSQSQLSTDDPGNRNQLDPDNPITMCTQEVRASGKMETRKSGSYIYDDDSKPVPGDFAVPVTESELVLTFPRVPYLPWQLVRPYINTINSFPVLGVGTGELLLVNMGTRVEPGPNGLQQNVQLIFAVAPVPGFDWNHLPKPDGTLQPVRIAADAASGTPRRIYDESDFREIFNQISFVES